MIRYLLATCLLLSGTAGAADPLAVALTDSGSARLVWAPSSGFAEATLTVVDPAGLVRQLRFGSGESPALSLSDDRGAPLPDGTYTWEIRSTPQVGASSAESGYFTISQGNLVAPEAADPMFSPDQTVLDDLIVDGKGCIGLGCTNNEAFGSETLRLKQSVVRLRFQDTSTNTGFPSNDWQITVNDSASGGANRFSIEDIDGAKTPLTLRAGAPDNSIYIDSTGRLGVGTATPSERLHVFDNVDANTLITAENIGTGLSAAGVLRARSNSASVNFQAHGSGRTISRFGQPLASWTEFLQVTGNGLIIGTLADKPLILGTNSTNRIHVLGSGNIGIGTASPLSKLHVNGGDIRVQGGSFIDDGTTLNVPDYVFEPGYRLMSLDELQEFISRERHLPNVPSAADIKKEGLNLSQIQMQLLEKIEELALYTLAQRQQIAAQQARITDLQEENARLDARLAALEKAAAESDSRP